MPKPTHRLTKTKEYYSWQHMRARCLRPQNVNFSLYGGRGISICKEWDKFETFLKDMGSAPSKSHTLDRIDNNGNYCKSNCRWATRIEQVNNRRCNHMVTHNEVTLPLSTWAERLGYSPATLWLRVVKKGMSFQEAISVSPGKRTKKKECINGHQFVDGSYLFLNGTRLCRSCRRINDAKFRLKQKQITILSK